MKPFVLDESLVKNVTVIGSNPYQPHKKTQHSTQRFAAVTELFDTPSIRVKKTNLSLDLDVL